MKKTIISLMIFLFVSSLVLTVITFGKSADAARPIQVCGPDSEDGCNGGVPPKKVGDTCGKTVNGELKIGECKLEDEESNKCICEVS